MRLIVAFWTYFFEMNSIDGHIKSPQNGFNTKTS